MATAALGEWLQRRWVSGYSGVAAYCWVREASGAPKGAVCCDPYSVLPAEIDQIILAQVRMTLDLQRRGLHQCGMP